ncbi:MAG TPA: DUF4142 domain-containing protein [Myxococcota bacterium]|nr:DUF4142 domain-containing protein [Myxococcota bacterium]
MRETALMLLSMVTAVAFSSVDPATLKQSQDFVKQAAIASRYQIEAAELARGRGNEITRRFAMRTRDEQVRTQRELADLARSQGLAVPSKVDAEREAQLVRLGTMEGEDFDREFARQAVASHQSAVTLFQGESSGGRDAELRSFAIDTLPVLQGALQRAEDLPKE